MEVKRSCLTESAVRKGGMLEMNGHDVGMAQWDETFHRVETANLDDVGAIGHVLLRELGVFNFVPSNMEADRRMAALEECKRRR